MNDHYTGAGGHNSRPLVRESREDLSFSVNREVFLSREIFEREQRSVFDRCWIYVGHASELRNPGDYKTRSVAGRPVIFCRGRDGRVHGLINSCRHRGAVVCREREGNARNFYCMYHGWTYNTDGTLRGVPDEESYPPSFDKSRMGLAHVPRLESYKDFYFANFDRDAVDLDTYLAGAKAYIDLVVDQSPSGRMEIISGVQEYDIKANWKLLVENSVDDYHLVATHATWLNYMRNSGVNMSPPKGSGLLLPTKGLGRDLGNGHLTTDNPNYRGRPVARWISVYGEDAKADIDAIRAELVARLGEARAARIADTNRNLAIFPNLVINDGSSVTVRNFTPVAPDLMHVTAWALGPVEETEAQRARRLHAFLTFYGPGGFATPDDVAALEFAQQGYASWREVHWNDLSRGMGKNEHTNTDEEHLRVFWRRWNELMEAHAPSTYPAPLAGRAIACGVAGSSPSPLVGEGRGGGSGRLGTEVPQSSTPTPDPSPQGGGGRAKAATVSRAEIEDFLFQEADLLDNWKLDEWLTLLTGDAAYYVPPNDKPDADHRFTLFTIADDIVRLRERVVRLKDPNCHAEYPPSRTRRLITNVRIVRVDGDTIAAAANFVVYRYRRGEPVREFVGHYRHKLRRVGGVLKIAERRAILDAHELGPMGSVSFIL